MKTIDKKPAISIVIPAYNAEKTILDTITSAQNQTFSDFEIIIINDGSTDKTLELINTLKDIRIKVFSYDNRGLSTARNRGIGLAVGDFITFLDADDLWTADKLELQFLALQNYPKAGLAYSWTSFMDEQGKTYYADKPKFVAGDVLKELLQGNFLCSGSNPLIKRSVIEAVGEFDPTLRSAEDWNYWLRIAERWEFALVPKAQIFYRQSAKSMSSKVEYMEKFQLEVVERAFKSAPKKLKGLKVKSLSYIYQYSAKLYLERNLDIKKLDTAIRKLGQSIRLYPQSLLVRRTQILLIKVIILKFLPLNVSRSLLKKIGKIRSISIQNSDL
jgi:glycosyltransferase involved in cell wall biosynthesis